MSEKEYYGSYILMGGKSIPVDTRKDLENAMIENGAELAIARSASHILFESLLDTQWKIAHEMAEKRWNEDGKLEYAPCPFPKERPQ